MELKPGYKQTEVGVIPEDGMLKLLRELAIVEAVIDCKHADCRVSCRTAYLLQIEDVRSGID